MAAPGARRLYPSLTLGRLRRSALRFLSGVPGCDKVCHPTRIRRDLCLPAMSALFRVSFLAGDI